MAKRIKLAKLIGWPLVAAVPFVFGIGIEHAYAKVGVASAVNGEPRSKQPNEVERVLHIGNDMIANEVVKTGTRDRAHIVFLDGSTLTVGPNSQITIDKFVSYCSPGCFFSRNNFYAIFFIKPKVICHHNR